MKSIGELTKRVSTWNPARAGTPTEFDYIDLSAIDNVRKEITGSVQVATDKAPSRARQLVAAGDVLVSTVRPNLNAVAVVPPALDGATASTGFAVLRPTDDLYGRYLFHWVRSRPFITDMVRKATGASYPAVSDRIVKGCVLPLPALDEQRRIAAIFDQIDDLRTKRRQALAHLDDLTSSLFMEMIDEISSNAWQPFGEVCSRVTVGVVVKPASHYVAHGIPALRTLNVKPGRLDLRDLVYISASSNDGPLAKSKLRAGDLVVARTGRPGTAAVIPSELDGANAIDLIVTTPDPNKALPEYLEGLMNSVLGQRMVAGEQRGQIQQHFNVGSLNAAFVPIPPIEAQRRLAERLSEVKEQKRRLEQHSYALTEVLECAQSRLFADQAAVDQ